MKIAIQGIRGSFHEAAAGEYYGDEVEIIECNTFRDLCKALSVGAADQSLMAIENTIAGSILSNYALISEYGFKITGEVYLPIEMTLMAIPNTSISDIQVVESHPMALQQCQEFILNHLSAECKESNDTAESARSLSQSKDTSKAVVAPAICAELYGLEVKKKGIESNAKNYTRFLILSKTCRTHKSNNKATLRIRPLHGLNGLTDILSILKVHHLRLTALQNLPVVGKPLEYFTYMDITWDTYSHYQAASHAMSQQALTLEILGEYEKATIQP